MFDYSPLWKTMERKGITQYQLIKEYNFSTGTLDSLRKNNSVTVNTLETLCLILDCTPNDILKVEQEHHDKNHT
ncbi:MAG: helix-turn-helix transcriptional regulator [Lachnospiraceae bacterium]|nr:helix-turn-helix transcriptional regulator [Lachnospiraceae bacterium]